MIFHCARGSLALVAGLASLLSVGCSKETAPPAGELEGVVALVNGTAITEADLELATRSVRHGAEPAEIDRRTALESLIRLELQRQDAVARGLDAKPPLAERLRLIEAQHRAAVRRLLAEAWQAAEIAEQAAATPAEIDAWLETNGKQLGKRYRLQQIMHKGDEAAARADLDAIRAGTSFDEVAARKYPGLPAGSIQPWNLDVQWTQMPNEWRPVVAGLAPGEVSDLIVGEGPRYWILRLVGVSDETPPAFDHKAMRTLAEQAIVREKTLALRTDRSDRLREKAEIRILE